MIETERLRLCMLSQKETADCIAVQTDEVLIKAYRGRCCVLSSCLTRNAVI